MPATVRAGEVATLTGRLDEAAPHAKHAALELTGDWGDRSAPDVSQPGRKPFRRTHRYAAPGTYTFRVIWTDTRTGESNFRDLRLTVTAATPGAAPSGHGRVHRVAVPRR
jgi:hypothetical protein